MTAREDIATVAGQLAALTQSVEEMAGQLNEVRERSESERERMDIQQERIDLAARELTDVSGRLQAAANASESQSDRAVGKGADGSEQQRFAERFVKPS
jgi:molecular chaperone GrpE (heat shock protein)